MVGAEAGRHCPTEHSAWGGAHFVGAWLYAGTQADMARLTPWAIGAIVLVMLVAFRDPVGAALGLASTGIGILAARAAMAAGRRADLMVFSDLQAPVAEMVYRGGKLAAQNGQTLPWERHARRSVLRSSMNVDWSRVNFTIDAQGSQVRIIGAIPDQLITRHIIEETPGADGKVVADSGRDIAKMAVIERHLATGNVGKGLVRGLGLKQGAIASTVAHDHHNIVVVGMDDHSMMTAAKATAETRGGMAAAQKDTVLAQLPLSIAGLMSDQPIERVRDQMDELLRAAHQLGSPLHDPFMAMSFLALPVIPSLKLTDHGLVDVDKFELVSLFV